MIITAENRSYPKQYIGKKGRIVGCANVQPYCDCNKCSKNNNGCIFSKFKLMIDGTKYVRLEYPLTDSGIGIVDGDKFMLDESEERVNRMVSI